MRHRRRALHWIVSAALVPLLVVPTAGVAQAEAVGTVVATVAEPTVTFIGHGWGHGRGMGQYGALGYATMYDKSYTWILDHFYGGTSAGAVGNPTISVELLGLSSKPLIVTGKHVYVRSMSTPGTLVDLGTAARFTVRADGHVKVEKGAGCSTTSWELVSDDATYQAGSTRVQAATGASDVTDLLRACYLDLDPKIERAYRGELSIEGTSTAQLTFNRVATEDYLRGVVPRESPSSWGDLAGGKGMEALKAQAVAARSYALSSSRPSGATTCDTTACQVYGGAGIRYQGFTVESLEAANTNAAVTATAGQVRIWPGSGAVARTEFSSSTGGYTVGGAFAAVPDDGDAVAQNPNHDWTVAYPLSTVAAKLGLSGVRGITVTQRNGLGDLGGRVLSVQVVDDAHVTHTYTGATFRSKMGTSQFKSDWFAVSMVNQDEAENVVRALYWDLLGRRVDSSGLATWTRYLMTTGDTAGLVRSLATSRERLERLVSDQYRSALNRVPEPEGLSHWVAHLDAGWGVYDLQIAIYGSPESLSTLGRGDVKVWIGALYRRILGRTASAGERTYWAQIAAVSGRETVVAGIAQSDEATMRRLTVYYRTFLGRQVDASGKATFLPMMTARGDFDVPVHLGSSPEYWSKAQE
ncbi:hypothetical protein OEB99_16070 [Actinotalea sp. M2MS4P-6]|uniref:SpoIID/LytB domain-containing protein n=1 Tax=Actinotalea sp. M2MS4P-6 TaxID=2983762 RepID=UPI0021E4189F|nr:SpoIID/LytB domain-containing protein [Actinotalea sp. M2MS4P-6]MCV2395832.1 hypothetical protein [Actinotalea sp. M2MS4P-6]